VISSCSSSSLSLLSSFFSSSFAAASSPSAACHCTFFSACIPRRAHQCRRRSTADKLTACRRKRRTSTRRASHRNPRGCPGKTVKSDSPARPQRSCAPATQRHGIARPGARPATAAPFVYSATKTPSVPVRSAACKTARCSVLALLHCTMRIGEHGAGREGPGGEQGGQGTIADHRPPSDGRTLATRSRLSDAARALPCRQQKLRHVCVTTSPRGWTRWSSTLGWFEIKPKLAKRRISQKFGTHLHHIQVLMTARHSPASRVAAKERRRVDGIAMWLRERGSGEGARQRRLVRWRAIAEARGRGGLLRVPLLPSLPFAAARCTACSPQSG